MPTPIQAFVAIWAVIAIIYLAIAEIEPIPFKTRLLHLGLIAIVCGSLVLGMI
jgi:uncharacterized membrane protein